MKILTIGNVIYLGTLTEKAGAVTITNALCLGAVTTITRDHLAAYLMAENDGTLEKRISIRGAGATFSERDLPADLELELKILQLKLEQAKGKAMPALVNDTFKTLI